MKKQRASENPNPNNPTLQNTDHPSSSTANSSNLNTSSLAFNRSSFSSVTQAAPIQIPLIFLTGLAWRQVDGKLMSTVPDGSHTEKNSIKLQCCDSELFRIIQKYLHKNHIKFHTFQLAEKRLFKVIIKGLLPGITESELAEKT